MIIFNNIIYSNLEMESAEVSLGNPSESNQPILDFIDLFWQLFYVWNWAVGNIIPYHGVRDDII